MIIRIILIAIACLLLIWYLHQHFSSRRQALSKIAAAILFILAVVSIISPNLTNRVAHIVGVGRGADLLLYILIVAFVISSLTNYIQRTDDRKKLIILARHMAISDANQSARNKQQLKKLNLG